MIGDYENFITSGPCYIDGRFMEKVVLAKGFLHKLFKKKTLFFKEFVVYAFVSFKGHKKGFFLSMEECVEVLNQVGSYGLSQI